ncbi:hypothetical protein GGI1_17203, partial [Acidithiobacillus sp. GGI-221]
MQWRKAQGGAQVTEHLGVHQAVRLMTGAAGDDAMANTVRRCVSRLGQGCENGFQGILVMGKDQLPVGDRILSPLQPQASDALPDAFRGALCELLFSCRAQRKNGEFDGGRTAVEAENMAYCR